MARLKYYQYKQYNQNVTWSGPDNVYIVTTDQATFQVIRHRLDYKKTIANLKAAGYTNINICYVGKNVTIH